MAPMFKSVTKPLTDRVRFNVLLHEARMQAGIPANVRLPKVAREYFWNDYRTVAGHLDEQNIVKAWATYLGIMVACHVIA